jgi:hypothetical protein
VQTDVPNGPIAVQDFYQELFHYTSAAGLVGIIESQRLRATHAGFLNDASEIKVFFASSGVGTVSKVAMRLFSTASAFTSY